MSTAFVGTGPVEAFFDTLIWAEESGGLSANNRQWSFGNGATGNINIPVPNDGEIVGLSFDSEVFGTSVTMELMVNDVAAATSTFASPTYVPFVAPVAISAGDSIGFRTDVLVGGFTDARVAAVYRQKVQFIGNLVKGDKGDEGDPGTMSIVPGYALVPGTQNVNVTTGLDFASLDPDSGVGWAVNANALEYTGSPTSVLLSLNVPMNAATAQRAGPSMRIQRNGVDLSPRAYSYIRITSGHNDDSINMTFIDMNPGTDPSYTVQCAQESLAGVTTAVGGGLQAEARL